MRNHVFDVADLLFEDEHIGVFQHGFHAGAVGDEVGRQVAPVELHPFDPFDCSVCRLLPSSTVITPSLPTLLIASASKFADFTIVVAGDRRDVGHLSLVFDLGRHLCSFSVMSATAASMPDFI